MSTPTPPAINPGDSWQVLSSSGLGTGVGAIPASAEIVINAVLPPYSPGVTQANENTITATYTWQDWVQQPDGREVQANNSRLLAYPESTFREIFGPVTTP